MRKNHVVTQIVLATIVPSSNSGAVHKNRPSHGIALNCAGKKQYIFDNGTNIIVHENDIIYLPKYSNYEVITLIPGDVWCINFQLLDEEIYQPFICHIPNTNEIIKSYQNAEKVWKRVKPCREYIVLSEIYKIFSEIDKAQNSPYLPKTKQEICKPAIDYIHKHYTDKLISVEMLSELCGISANYLRKLFQKFYGCSPIKYINELKLKRAKELLKSGLYSVSEAAYNSGFSDLSHFSRFFTAKVGILPVEYKHIKNTDNIE